MTEAFADGNVVDLHPDADPADPERLLLGCLLGSKAARDEVESLVSAEDFARHSHGLVFRCIGYLHGRGDAIDPTLVRAALERAGYGDKAPSGDVLRAWRDEAAASSVRHAVGYGEAVRGRSALRVVADVGRDLLTAGADPSVDPVEVVEVAQKAIDRAASRVLGTQVTRPLGEELDASIERLERGDRGLSTGLQELDRLIGGLRPGTMTVVAGGTSAGKSLLAETVALHVVRHGVPCYAASVEMTRHEWYLRAWSALQTIDLSRLIRGGKHLTEDDWRRIATARGQMEGWPLWVDDRELVTAPVIRAGARTWFRRHGPGLLIVDYLQLVKPTGRHQNREREVAEVAEDLRAIGKTLGVPVLALSQLNDEHLKQRGSGGPGLHSLRESRVIGQTADVVVLLSRDTEKNPDMLQVNVAKNRNGQTGRFDLRWEGRFARVSSAVGLWHQDAAYVGGEQ